MNATFMLLTWGANPNAEDQNGICPLLWLLQNNNTTRGFEMSKLLIQFGATVTCTEPRTKNSLLHFLAQSKKFDLIQAFYFYHNNPGFFRLASNAAGQSVYKVSHCNLLSTITTNIHNMRWFYRSWQQCQKIGRWQSFCWMRRCFTCCPLGYRLL